MRKNAAILTSHEKERFVAAVLAIKKRPSVLRPNDPTWSRYDDFVQVHIEAMSGMRAHMGPAFGPWHRVLLWEFEKELQAVDTSVSIPYWDSCDPANQSPTSPLFQENFLGGNGVEDVSHQDKVVTGAFAADAGNWPIVVSDPDAPPQIPQDYMSRGIGRQREEDGTLVTLFQKRDESNILNRSEYDLAPWMDHGLDGASRIQAQAKVQRSFRYGLERALHNVVHRWVGGCMATGASPNDPVFWLHHSNMDRLWAQWQLMHAQSAPYLPTTGTEHALHDPLVFRPSGGVSPWAQSYRPVDVLDLARYVYIYDSIPRPVTVPVLQPMTVVTTARPLFPRDLSLETVLRGHTRPKRASRSHKSANKKTLGAKKAIPAPKKPAKRPRKGGS